MLFWYGLVIVAAFAMVIYCGLDARKSNLLPYIKTKPQQPTPLFYKAVAACDIVLLISGLTFAVYLSCKQGDSLQGTGWIWIFLFLSLCCLSILLVDITAMLDWRKAVCEAEKHREGESS